MPFNARTAALKNSASHAAGMEIFLLIVILAGSRGHQLLSNSCTTNGPRLHGIGPLNTDYVIPVGLLQVTRSEQNHLSIYNSCRVMDTPN
jgi:hypothetical protein